MSLEEIRRTQDKFCEDRLLSHTHTPRNLVFAMVSDVGELCDMFQWRPDAPIGLATWSDRERKNVGARIADVVLAATRLAQQCGVDLSDAVAARQDAKARECPAARPTPSPIHVIAPLTPVAKTPPNPNNPNAADTFWVLMQMVQDVNTPRGETLTEQQFAQLNLRFVIMVKGHEVELTRGGRGVRVTLANKDLFVTMASDRYAAEHSRRETIELDVPNDKFDPSKVSAKFSPTHFEKGIFSPHLDAKKVYDTPR